MILRLPSSTLFPYTTLFRSLSCSVQCEFLVSALDASKSGDLSRAVRRPLDRDRSPDLLASREIGRAHVELQSPVHLVCRLLLEKKNKTKQPQLHAQASSHIL